MNKGRVSWVWLVAICAIVLAVPALAPAQSSSLLEIPDPAQALAAGDPQMAIHSHPQALPNDGDSSAEITVSIAQDDTPVEGLLVTARVVQSDGTLDSYEVETDVDGAAVFRFRAGVLPETPHLSFTAEGIPEPEALTIPIAPIAYMDVKVVTPEEYAAFRKRQASAAPIYKLETDSFPSQLAADGGSMSTISARLTMADGKPAPGVPLSAKIMSGDGDLAMDQVATDTNGDFKLYYIAGFTPGTVTIAVIEPSTGLTVSTDIILVEAGPVRIELLYLDPISPEPLHEGAILPADGLTALPMLARVTDLNGLPVTGIELRVELVDSVSGWIELLDPVSDVAGEVDFNYYAGTTTGKVRLRAFAIEGMEI
jgi:hypothetical protein